MLMLELVLSGHSMYIPPPQSRIASEADPSVNALIQWSGGYFSLSMSWVTQRSRLLDIDFSVLIPSISFAISG